MRVFARESVLGNTRLLRLPIANAQVGKADRLSRIQVTRTEQALLRSTIAHGKDLTSRSMNRNTWEGGTRAHEHGVQKQTHNLSVHGHSMRPLYMADGGTFEALGTMP